jgi:aspartate kinase
MGPHTDELLDLAYQITEKPDARELDMLLTVGERISMSLLSMALISMGYHAISLTGSQAGIVTDTRHGKARISKIEKDRFTKYLDADKIVIIAGFQGISIDKEITTLGRGGSDLTAVAIAAAIGAKSCYIYTDVDGVFTADPAIVPNAKKIDFISTEEMLELADEGANVLYSRAMELAGKHDITIQVLSSFSDNPGTFIKEMMEDMEQVLVKALACESNQSQLKISSVPDCMQSLSAIFNALSAEDINVNMIGQNLNSDGSTDISFTIDDSDLDRTYKICTDLLPHIKGKVVLSKKGLSKLSIVGIGMKSNSGVAAMLFSELAKNNIAIEMISTSDIKISVLVSESDVAKAAQLLHDVFRLADGGIKI